MALYLASLWMWISITGVIRLWRASPFFWCHYMEPCLLASLNKWGKSQLIKSRFKKKKKKRAVLDVIWIHWKAWNGTQRAERWMLLCEALNGLKSAFIFNINAVRAAQLQRFWLVFAVGKQLQTPQSTVSWTRWLHVPEITPHKFPLKASMWPWLPYWLRPPWRRRHP